MTYSKHHLKLRKNGAFVYQRRVPRHLQATVGKASWFKYIGKVTPTKAVVLARAEDAKADRTIAQLHALASLDKAAVAQAGGFHTLLTDVSGQSVSLPFQSYAATYDEASVNLDDDDAIEQIKAIREAKALLVTAAAQRPACSQDRGET